MLGLVLPTTVILLLFQRSGEELPPYRLHPKMYAQDRKTDINTMPRC